VRQRWDGLISVALLIILGVGCTTALKQGGANLASQPVSMLLNATAAASRKSVWHKPKREIDTLDKFSPIFWFGNIDAPVLRPATNPQNVIGPQSGISATRATTSRFMSSAPPTKSSSASALLRVPGTQTHREAI